MSLSLAAMPSGVLKTLIVETALQAKPTVVVIDEFENSLHPDLQQFLMDELRNSGAYVFLTTHSTVPLDYVKSPSEVVVLRLEGGETKAYRLREEARDKEVRLNAQRTCAFRPVRAYWMKCIYFVRDNRCAKELGRRPPLRPPHGAGPLRGSDG